jgi:hypothetical protein
MQLNIELYYTHIQNANNWQHTWTNIEQSINQKLHDNWKEYTKTTQNSNLSKSETTNTINKNTNYHRIINNTNPKFTQEEIQVVSKGPVNRNTE